MNKIKFSVTNKIYDLMKEIDIDSEKELFNGAFSLLQFVAREVKKGNKIVSLNKNKNTYKELDLSIYNKISGKSEIFD